MIESGFLPRHHVVTGGAVFSQGLLVDILLRVAADAGGRCIAVFRLRLVAVSAGDLLVGALKREIRQSMIEGLRRQADDVCAAAFVVRVTVPALARPGLLGSPVKPHLLVDVRGNLVMAVDAKLALVVPRERYMTLPALTLDVSVATDHRTWRYEALPIDSTCRKRRQHAYDEED